MPFIVRFHTNEKYSASRPLAGRFPQAVAIRAGSGGDTGVQPKTAQYNGASDRIAAAGNTGIGKEGP